MNKKFLSAILFGALMVTSTGTFVSCKDYDDDIDEINKELTDIKSQIAALQNQINSGEWVSGVTSTSNGIIVTLGNGQSYTITNGAAGANGENGKTPVLAVNEDMIQVSYDDGATWEDLIALADLKGEAGEAGAAAVEPVFTVGEDGHLYVQYGEDGEKKDLGISTGGIYCVEDGVKLTLHIPNEDGEYVDVVVPRAAAISGIKVVGTGDSFNWEDCSSQEVTLVYGQNTQGKAVEFNGKTYAQNALMTSAEAKVTVQVNPTLADATVYNFYLTDSKGNSLFDLGTASVHMSETAITRAATANKGLYVVPVTIKAGTSVSSIENRDCNIAYAVATKDAYDNEILSEYQLKVKTETGNSSLELYTGNKEVEINKAFDLSTLVKTTNVIDVKYSFSTGQTSAVDAAGASISGASITGTKAGKSVKVTVSCLKNDGSIETKTDAIEIKFIAAATENTYTQTITPTGEADKDVVTFDLTSIFGNTASSVSATVNNVVFTAAATDKNTKTEYAKNDVAVGIAAPAAVTSTAVKSNGVETGYYTQSVTYGVDAKAVIPGTYKATVTYGSSPVNTVTLTIIVNDPASTFDIKPLSLYFSGNNAVAYGTKSETSNKITYNLKGLFGITGADWNYVSFSETVPEDYKDADGVTWTANEWLGSTFGEINVDRVAYKISDTEGFFGGAYKARALKATYQPLANKNFEAVAYDFNLTIKSAIYEGSLSYVKPTPAAYDENGNVTSWTYPAGTAKSISVVSENPTTKLTAAEIRGIDIEGKAYNPSDGETAKVQKATIALQGDNAKQYLEEEITGSWANGWTIKVKANVTAPADGQTVTCYVRVSVLDQWGKVKTVDVPVTLK